ncbi:hypothetical protein [Streptomyces sp. NPDC005281]
MAAAQLAARAQRVVPAGGSAPFLAPLPVGEVAPGRLADLLVLLGLVTIN